MEQRSFVYREVHRGLATEIEAHKILAAGHTEYQSYLIGFNQTAGHFLVLDGDLQSVEIGLAAYHEALVHPAMLLHPKPENVLIMGGGEGATLKEVLKHPTVKRVLMVDLDEGLVNLCRQHLSQWSGEAFYDKRVQLLHASIFEVVDDLPPSSFDVIIGDLPNDLMFHEESFYKKVKQILEPLHGILATQAGGADTFDSKIFTTIQATLEGIFPIDVWEYKNYIPGFFGLWGFVVVVPENIMEQIADGEELSFFDNLSRTFYQREWKRKVGRLQHYTPARLAACFL